MTPVLTPATVRPDREPFDFAQEGLVERSKGMPAREKTEAP